MFRLVLSFDLFNSNVLYCRSTYLTLLTLNKLPSCLVFSCIVLSASFVSCDRCCRIGSRDRPRYELIEFAARSGQQIVSRKFVSNVDECKEFAASRKALAFNYGRERNRGKTACQALECPELRNFTESLVQDIRYNYYSMYPRSITTGRKVGSLVCVPTVGMFLLSSGMLNYTEARAVCQSLNFGSLAHIVSEERTNGLARYVREDRPALVGLSNRDNETIWKNEFGEPLACFEYRAWGPGEPSRARGCVTLVRPKSGSREPPFWRVVPCYTSLSFICELSPVLQGWPVTPDRHQ